MIFIHFSFIAVEAIVPRDDNPKVPNTLWATDLTNGKAIWIKEAIPSPN